MIELIITSSILIFAVVLMRHVLKGKITLKVQYALWALVLVRLLIPFSLFESNLSILNAIEMVNFREEWSTAPSFPAVSAPSPPPGDTTTPVLPNTTVQEGTGTITNVRQIFDWHKLARLIWYLGIGAVGLCLLTSNLIFTGRLIKTRKKCPVINCRLPVYEIEESPSSFLFGVLRPAIYITPEVARDETKLRHVLAHELTHYRHGDHIWSVLRSLCLAVHWYNPLVWLAAILSRRDAELACDESTIKSIGEANRLDYGRTLIGLTSEKRSAYDLFCCATTMSDGKSGIRERITMIAKRPKMAIRTLVAVLLIAAAAVGCTFTGAHQGKISGGKGDNSADPPYFGVSATDPVETVREFLETEKEQDYTYSLEIYEIALSDSDTAKIIESFKGSDYARGKNWTEEYVENNIVAVAAYYSVQYDHDKIFYDDGEIVRRFFLKYDEPNGLWSIWANDGGMDLEAFLSGKNKWPDCLKKPEGIKTEFSPDTVKIMGQPLSSVFRPVSITDPETVKHLWSLYQGFEFDGTAETLDKKNLWNIKVTFSSAGGESIGFTIFQGGLCNLGDNYKTYYILQGGENLYNEFLAIFDEGTGQGDSGLAGGVPRSLGLGEAISSADIDRDGRDEKIYLEKFYNPDRVDSLDWVTLRVLNEHGEQIFSEDAFSAHVGWTSLFLCEQGGKEYLLRYNPAMFQGYCDYTYTLFTLEGGREKVYQTNTLEFDVNGTKPLDVSRMLAFADEINDLLKKSTLLLSSKGGVFTLGPAPAAPFFETYSWLNNNPGIFAEGDDLAVRLQKFSDQALVNRARMNQQ